MRLVFITRKVDRDDPLTGFVFSWLEKLARNLDKLYVICQEKGEASGLPDNVEVHSFGKERGYGKLRQAFTLFALSFALAKKSAGFFVHMHPVYAIIASLPAKLLGKKMVLWYTHKAVDWKMRAAHALVDIVFTASSESFRLPSKKAKIAGHGIDLNKFRMQNSECRIQNAEFRILSIGRISPVKDYETLIKAAEILYHHQKVKDIEVEIYGKIGLPEHQSYLDSLVEFVHTADLEGVVKFQGELNYEYVDEVYREADLFVNLSQTGSIDKNVLEAAASGTIVLTSNEAFQKSLNPISPELVFRRDHPDDLAAKIQAVRSWPKSQKDLVGKKLREWVQAEHNLENLVARIVEEFQT